MSIGEALAQRRDELGLTNEQAAHHLDTSGSLFGRWCNFKASPGDERVQALAGFLGWAEDDVARALYHQRIRMGGRSTGSSLGQRLSALERRVAALEERGSP